MSKSVQSDETGKMYSALAILCAAMPLIGNPAFRRLYDATLDTFPAAEILLAATIYAIAAILNLLLYAQRRKIDTVDYSADSTNSDVSEESEYKISHM